LEEPIKRRPNIIVCALDQLRPFEVGCYGNPVIRTTNIDRLAAEGLRFETAITNFPVCMAARSVLLSGQYNRRCTGGIGNVAFPFRPDRGNMPEYPDPGRPHLRERTLPGCLKEAGYHTAAIGKWHIHSWPHDVGFDYYLIPRVHHCHTGQCFTENGGPEFVPEGYSVDFESVRVADYLRARAGKDQPFFLYYNISPPHCPLADAPEKYLKMYSPEEVPIRPNVDLTTPLKDQDHWFRVYRYDFRYYEMRLPYTEHLPPGYDLRTLIAEYYGLTTWADDALGTVLRALDDTGLAEDTIVVLTSDHGDNLGSLGLVQKGGPNEESIRIPMLLRWPAVMTPGRVVREQIASLVDLMPTLLDLTGSPSQSHTHGCSLAAIIRGESETTARPHAFVETGHGAGIRTSNHLYFLTFAGNSHALSDRPSHFYNLDSDPYELHNCAEVECDSETAKTLDATLRDWDRATPWMTTT
jgi:arylsulfatase A-like enzyme